MPMATRDIGMIRQVAVKSPRSPDSSCSRRRTALVSFVQSPFTAIPIPLLSLVTCDPSPPVGLPPRGRTGTPRVADEHGERPDQSRRDRSNLGAMKLG